MKKLIVLLSIVNLFAINSMAQQDNSPIVHSSNIRNAYINHSIGIFYPKLNIVNSSNGYNYQSILGISYSIFASKSSSRINWEFWLGNFGIYQNVGQYNLSDQYYNATYPTVKIRIKPFINHDKFEIVTGVYYNIDLNNDFEIINRNFSIPLGVTFPLGSNPFWKHINLFFEPNISFNNSVSNYESTNISYLLNAGFMINIFTDKKIFKTDDIE